MLYGLLQFQPSLTIKSTLKNFKTLKDNFHWSTFYSERRKPRSRGGKFKLEEKGFCMV
jgi:hypothetical protein